MPTATDPRERIAWYRLPVLWLAVAVFVASLAGCVWLIVVSVQYRDEALPVASHQVLGVPAHPHPPPASSP